MESQAMSDPSGPQPDPGASMRVRLRKRARAITLVYASFAALWIFFSDALLAALVPEPRSAGQSVLALWSTAAHSGERNPRAGGHA